MKSIIFSLLVIVSLSACTNYGKKVKSGNIEVYYKEGVTEGQAKQTADLFYKAMQETNADSKGRKSFQMTKTGDTVLLKMVVNKEKMEKAPEESLYAISTLVSDKVFNDGPVNLILTDDKFKAIRTLVFKKTVMPDYGEKITAGNIEVYRKDVPSETADKLASFLNGYMNPENMISFQVSKYNNDELVIKMVSDPSRAAGVTNQQLSDLCTKISEEVLNGAPFVFQLTDENFATIKTFTYPTDANQ